MQVDNLDLDHDHDAHHVIARQKMEDDQATIRINIEQMTFRR